MSDERLKYDLAAMAEAHGDITVAAGRFRHTHNTVIELMRSLQKSWTDSDAASAWQAYQNEWNTVFADITAELIRLGDAVDTARQNGQRVENANYDLFAN